MESCEAYREPRLLVWMVDCGLWSKMHQQLNTRVAVDETNFLCLGPLHVVKAYLVALGVAIKGTGWGQALIKAPIVCGGGCLHPVSPQWCSCLPSHSLPCRGRTGYVGFRV